MGELNDAPVSEYHSRSQELIGEEYMDQIRNMIMDFLAGSYDPLDFSYDLPDLLIQKYDEVENKDATVNSILNENLPEICAEYERGEDPTYFMSQVYGEFKKAFPNESISGFT